MKISKQLYVDQDVQHLKWTLWNIKRNRKVKNVYCICIPYNKPYMIEILKGTHLKDQFNENILIGIATSKENAVNLIVKIFEEVYIPNPDVQLMKAYFVN